MDRASPNMADEPDDPEAALYSTVPLEDEDGNTYVIQQQNVGRENIEGGGEWPDPRPRRERLPLVPVTTTWARLVGGAGSERWDVGPRCVGPGSQLFVIPVDVSPQPTRVFRGRPARPE